MQGIVIQQKSKNIVIILVFIVVLCLIGWVLVGNLNLFLIRDKNSGEVWLAGRVYNPIENNQ